MTTFEPVLINGATAGKWRLEVHSTPTEQVGRLTVRNTEDDVCVLDTQVPVNGFDNLYEDERQLFQMYAEEAITEAGYDLKED